MKRTNKLLCLLLALVFVCGLLPATAAADTSCENGHDWFRVTVVREPTCTESGLRTGVCSRCGAQLEEAIPALGHDYVCYEHTPPTCTEPGTDEFKCSRCPQTWTQHFDPLGHEWETVRTEPHGLTDGSAVSTCARCGETETEIIPAAAAVFHMARNLPDDAEEAEDGAALRIVDQTYYELLTYGSGEGCTLFVTAEGGVTPYTYTWHYVTEFVPGSAVLDAATERYKGAQDAYAKKSAAVSSAFGAAAGAFALDGASLADGGEASGSDLRPFGDSAAAPLYTPAEPLSGVPQELFNGCWKSLYADADGALLPAEDFGDRTDLFVEAPRAALGGALFGDVVVDMVFADDALRYEAGEVSIVLQLQADGFLRMTLTSPEGELLLYLLPTHVDGLTDAAG